MFVRLEGCGSARSWTWELVTQGLCGMQNIHTGPSADRALGEKSLQGLKYRKIIRGGKEWDKVNM